MLSTLRIKNLALAADVTLELAAGFNAITGETGAGKSIIIGALNLVLGERADRTLIRSGCDSCVVEAGFDVTDLRAPLAEYLEQNGLEPCDQNQLILKRVFTAAGANRQFVNGSPTTLAVLSAIGQWLVDIHGPHEHQSLLQTASQLAILDAYGGLEERRETFAALVRRRADLEAQKAALVVDERTYAQQLDLLRFQVNEIDAARLQADEEAQLDQDFRRASNAARLLELSQTALNLVNADESSLLIQAGALGRALQELARLDSNANSMLALHEQMTAHLRELQSELSRYADRIDLDPARLSELESRINVITGLKRKYGAHIAEVLAFGEQARHQLDQLEKREVELERIQGELERLDLDLERAGKDLSTRRRGIIPKLVKAATKELADLGFKQSTFEVSITTESDLAQFKSTIPSSGLDQAEFEFAPNIGEPTRPLRAIASSGELARVMLALKTVLAAEDRVPVLVFDEVDANIGGETARIVGRKMRQIGHQRQVLCITHLAPVAVGANAHYRVNKLVKDGRTISEIHRLTQIEQITELARMLGGQSDAARKHAEAMLKTASN
ncbi:MAG: DNA repair protein RecN [Candidatus Omnitrophica bacterium]|nr:DNA repair protein RecN [Candidatus Omnitrophota bacterium]